MKKVRICVNGSWHEWIAGQRTVLLNLLREDLCLTGAKQSCDRKGQCGTCMVIVNKKAVRACLARIADLNGAEVITVEGLGTPRTLISSRRPLCCPGPSSADSAHPA